MKFFIEYKIHLKFYLKDVNKIQNTFQIFLSQKKV